MTRPVGRSMTASRLRPSRQRTRWTVEAGRATSATIRAGPSLRTRRSRAISASTLVGRRLGWVWAVLGRSWQAGRAVLLVAGPPAVGAGAGDAHFAGDVGDGAASGDALAQQQPSRWVRR